MIRQPIKLILLTENVFGMYRNLTWTGKLTRRIMFLRVILEISLVIVSVILNSHKKLTVYVGIHEEVYVYISASFTTVIMLLSIYHSNNFKKLITNLDTFCAYAYNNLDIIRLNFTHRILKCFLFVHIIMDFFLMILYYLSLGDSKLDIVNLLVDMCLYCSDFRLNFECFVICCILLEISYQINYIIVSVNTDIDIEKKKLSNNHFTNFSRYKYIRRKEKKMGRWTNAYASIDIISNLCNKIFGFQITIMVVLSVVTYIFLMYEITVLSVRGRYPLPQQLSYICLLLEYLVALTALAVGARQVQIMTTTLRKKLAMLLLLSSRSEVQYKTMRDFLRIVRTHPIKMTGFGSIDVDMTLLPTCLALCASNTVIALQFNNVF